MKKYLYLHPHFERRDSSDGAEKQQICDLHVFRASSIRQLADRD
jgi:hypothetical protein